MSKLCVSMCQAMRAQTHLVEEEGLCLVVTRQPRLCVQKAAKTNVELEVSVFQSTVGHHLGSRSDRVENGLCG